MIDLEIKSEYVICEPTLNKSVDSVKQRILERQEDEYDNDWDNGYTQSLRDVYNLLTGLEEWLVKEEE